MRNSRFSEEQMIRILQQGAKGQTTQAEVCSDNGVSRNTYCLWTRKNSGMETDDVSLASLQSEDNPQIQTLLRWSVARKLDCLTVANYNDGLPGSSQSWSYNAAGNRNDSVCRSGAEIPRRSRMSKANRDDNLNRATSIGGVSCTNDILGNRLTKGSNAYSWDILNRMVSFGQTEYRYRADPSASLRAGSSMRVQKISGSNATRYRYDGQMGIEDVAGSVVTRYGLGARGVDFIEQSNGTGSSVVFPVYDAHGNNVASLSRSGLGYNVTNRRSFDAWGSVRLGAQTGDPTGRYCANLGHKQDDESGLVYMRARYYEPASGRFVSEDPAMDGWNWYVYVYNNPVSVVDFSGRYGQIEVDGWFFRLDKIGEGLQLPDFAFGRDRRCNMGSYRIDGTLKHDKGFRIPPEVLKKLGQEKKFQSWLRMAVNSRGGSQILNQGGRDSISATFNYDPFFVIGLFAVLGMAGMGADSDDMWAAWDSISG